MTPCLIGHRCETWVIITNGTPKVANLENFLVTPAKTLDVDAEKRLDATQLLQHPFFVIAGPCALKVAQNK